MIQSMTGFSNVNCDLDNIQITLELRSVNNRFLDIHIRQPEEFRPFENILRNKIQAKVKRGKLECRINIKTSAGHSPQIQLNEHLVNNLIALNTTIRQLDQTLHPMSVADILQFPHVIEQNEIDSELFRKTIEKLSDEALEDFCASRVREGEKLKNYLLERLDSVEETVEKIHEQLPGLLEEYRLQLSKRLKEALTDIQDDRIKQEFSLFLQKADVEEELSRLLAHTTEVRRTLSIKNAVGKHLDFLMQEMNREANTLASKSIANSITLAAIELKVLIEQMREQIQNIE